MNIPKPVLYKWAKLVAGILLFLLILAFHGFVAKLPDYLLALPFGPMGVLHGLEISQSLKKITDDKKEDKE